MNSLVHSAASGSIPGADLSALIAKLEAEEGGSDDLSAHVWCAVNEGWRPGTGIQTGAVIRGGAMYTPDPVTTSLDAAMALAERVLPGHAMNVCKDTGPQDGPAFRWSSVIARHSLAGPVGRPGWWFGVSNTPALALCIAILKAHASRAVEGE